MRWGSEGSHPTNEVGDSEGKKALDETGEESTEGKKRKRARFRRRVSLPRPSLPKRKTPKLAPPKLPQGAGDLRFRFVTRLRISGYWLREKAQIVWRWLRRAAAAPPHLGAERPPRPPEGNFPVPAPPPPHPNNKV